MEKAVSSTPLRRAMLLAEMADLLLDVDNIFIGQIARKLAEHQICDKNDFVQLLKDRRKANGMPDPDQDQRRNRPTDPKLRNRYLAQQPDLIYGLESFRRYSYEVWPAVADNVIMKEIDDLLSGAESEGYRSDLSRVKSVFGLAKTRCYRPEVVWDANPNLLVCGKITIDLLVMEPREHRREDYATTRLPYNFDPSATAPTWMSVLARIETDLPGATSTLQEFAGLCLTGITAFEISLALFGSPGRGKSTIMEGLVTLLGDRAGKLDFRDLENSRFALHPVIGRTMLYSYDQKIGRFSASDLYNRLISGEPITIEFNGKTSYEVRLFAKMVFATNDLPRLDNRSDGFFRRTIIFPFDRVQATEPDIWIKDRIKAEGPGILNWALEGLARLMQRGFFEIPDWARKAREEYRNRIDPLPQWIKDECFLHRDHREPAGTLQDAFKTYCLENGYEGISSADFSVRLRELGITRHELNGRRYYRGIRLKQSEDGSAVDNHEPPSSTVTQGDGGA